MNPVAPVESHAPTTEHDGAEPSGRQPTVRTARRRRLITGVATVLVFTAGVGTGFALPHDTSALVAARAEVKRTGSQVETLKAALADAREDKSSLAGSLTEAVAAADEAGKAAAAQERKLDAREAALDERDAELDDREAELAEADVDTTGGASSTPAGSGSLSDFDQEWASDIASDIVQDIRTVDHRLGDGIAVESALYLLAGDFPRLHDAGIPPGVDEANYVARLQTLESFTDEAANTYSANPTEGSAQYAVVREQTGVLLDDLNGAIGTDFRLP